MIYLLIIGKYDLYVKTFNQEHTLLFHLYLIYNNLNLYKIIHHIFNLNILINNLLQKLSFLMDIY